jgi:hypothetical protein
MLRLENRTPYSAERAVLADLDGSEIWVVVVKATFDLSTGHPVVADEQMPVCLTDEYHGKPGESSLKYESDLAFRKPATDVVLNGHAYAPNGKSATRVDASIKVGPIQKSARVYGDRHWRRGVLGLRPSKPKPFDRIPLLYERAYGGIDTSSDDPKKSGAEERNPIGAGFGLSKTFLRGKPLPNIEDPRDEIRRWHHRKAPVGFGLVCRHWLPRRTFVGTCDERWLATRCPLYPDDFDTCFLLGASAGLTATPHLRGGEPVEIAGMTPSSKLSFELPRVAISMCTRISDRWIYHHAQLASVIIEPDVPRVMLVWQSTVPCHRKKFELDLTRILEKRVVKWA